MNPAHDDPNRTTDHATTDGYGPHQPILDTRTEMGPRFQVLRPHARGGLGEVFVARDGELNREVALKEMRTEFACDDASRARFLLEAEITGALEHPGIVPIYGLGRHADGRPFYAMRFIHGESLAEAIHRFHAAAPTGSDPGERSLELRRLLTRFVAVCEAVAYAHSRGVLHRDLKPANVMLGPYGETLVVDWGLAKSLDSPAAQPCNEANAGTDAISLPPQSSNDAASTRPGTVLGTPAYMSPEQAAGRLDQLGPATDVYGLGATLYCLLTGRAPFSGTDVAQLLQRVRQGEWIAARQVRASVPRALEAICRNAMALRPEERYPSAKALAEDVEHWLADEPVSAYREPLRARVGRWARRHRPLVAGLSALLLALLLLGGGGLGWWQWRLALVEAAATDDLTRAEELLVKDAPATEVLQAVERAEGRLSRDGAERLRERVRQLRAWVAFAERLDEARQLGSMMTKEGGLDFAGGDRAYQAAFAEHGLDVAVLSPEEAAARIRSAPIRTRLVTGLDSWAYFKDRMHADSGESLRSVAQLADDNEWRQRLRDPDVRKDRARLEALAERADALEQVPVNIFQLARALETAGATTMQERLLRQAQQRYPDDFWINYELAYLLDEKLETREEAVGFMRAAMALQPRNAATHNNLAILLDKQGKRTEAEAEVRAVLRILPDSARHHNNLGGILYGQGKRAEAEAEIRAALRIQPDYPFAHGLLGNVLRDQGKLPEAEAEYRIALRHKPDLTDAHYTLALVLDQQGKYREAETEYRSFLRVKPDHADAHVRRGKILCDRQGKPGEGEAEFRAAIRLKPDLAEAHFNLGVVLLNQGKPGEAEKAFRAAIRLKPDVAEYHSGLGQFLGIQGKPTEAETEFRTALRIKPDDLGAHVGLGSVLHAQGKLREAEAENRAALRISPNSVNSHYNLGNVLLEQGKFSEAETEYRAALRLRPDYAEAHCNLGSALRQQGRFTESLASLQRGHELGSKMPGWRYPTAQWIRITRTLVDLDAQLMKILAGDAQPASAAECLQLASFCRRYKHLHAAAARFYTDAFVQQPKLAEQLLLVHRYNAACAAALAGCGQGKDAEKLDDKERGRLRKQALDWLRANLTACGERLTREPDKSRPEVLAKMKHWQQDVDFAGVRGDAVDKLPEAERASWRKTWDDVEALRRASERK